MSRSLCITCGTSVRDHDDPTGMKPQPLGLPEHTAPAGVPCRMPLGNSEWNDGRHYWCDYTMSYRLWPPIMLAPLATNLTVAAALCRAFELGDKAGFEWTRMPWTPELHESWRPGCGKEAP